MLYPSAPWLRALAHWIGTSLACLTCPSAYHGRPCPDPPSRPHGSLKSPSRKPPQPKGFTSPDQVRTCRPTFTVRTWSGEVNPFGCGGFLEGDFRLPWGRDGGSGHGLP